MEVHQLRYFCAVSETGSFTRAAEREQVAQPSLSQQIMKLEEELGVRLFDRLGRTVRLTGFGQVFLPRARAILGELKAAKDEVAERQSSVSGPVSIGVIPTIAPYFLPLPLALFSRKYPQASITVTAHGTAVCHPAAGASPGKKTQDRAQGTAGPAVSPAAGRPLLSRYRDRGVQ